MAGKLIELPKRLEWKPVETWVGKVAGTPMWTQVTSKEGGGYQWLAWSGPMLVNSGEAKTSGEAMKAAEEALETGVLVVHPLPQRGGT